MTTDEHGRSDSQMQVLRSTQEGNHTLNLSGVVKFLQILYTTGKKPIKNLSKTS